MMEYWGYLGFIPLKNIEIHGITKPPNNWKMAFVKFPELFIIGRLIEPEGKLEVDLMKNFSADAASDIKRGAQ